MGESAAAQVHAMGSVGVIDGTELVGEFKGSGYRDASMLICRFDGKLVRLPPLLYTFVEALMKPPPGSKPGGHPEGMHTLATVAAAVNSTAKLSLSPDHVRFILDRKLAPLGISTRSDGSLPPIANPAPPLSLRWKKPLIAPHMTWVLGGLFSWLFRAPVMAIAVSAALAAEVWILATAPVGRALQETLSTPGSLLLIVLLALVSTLFHEIGHAAACRYGGARPGAIGCGLYIVWPVFYTDVTSSYRLGRRARLRTDLGGVYFNTLVVLALASLYAVSEDSLLLVAILMINVEMLQQLLPFLRFDGYYIVSDFVGVPDLFRYVGPILRRHLLRQEQDSRLTALKTWPQRIVTAWVLVVVPALIAQLVILGGQMPDLIAALVEKTVALSDASSVSEAAADLVQILLLALPLAGVLFILAPLVRGLWRSTGHVNRSATTGDDVDEQRRPPIAAVSQEPSRYAGAAARLPVSRTARARALASVVLAASGLLLLAAGLVPLAFGGNTPKPVAMGSSNDFPPLDTASQPQEVPTAEPTEPTLGSATKPSTTIPPQRPVVSQATLAARPTSQRSVPPATAPAAAPNDRITFNSWRDGNVEIYTMNADGSGVARLTNNTANDWAPRWSPDKTRIAFYSDRSGNDDIYSMNADGSGLVKLTSHPATDSQPDWSPDGTRIVFTSTRDGGGSNLYVMNADGTAPTRITRGAWIDVAPDWSRDGSRIAFSSSRDGNYEIYLVNPDGSGATRLTNHAASDYDPSWSPDGTKIAFWSERDGNGEIYVMNADGTSPTRLTVNLVADGFPCWSPDGTRLAFQTNRNGNLEIYVMAATGEGLLGGLLSQQGITNHSAADGVPDW